MPITFTDGILKARRKPRHKDKFIAGAGSDRQLRIRHYPSGLMSWYFFYTFEGKDCNFKFGRYPSMPIEEARDMAKDYRRKISEGINPKIVKTTRRSPDTIGTVRQLFDQYYLYLKSQKTKTLPDIKSTMENNSKPILNLLAGEVTTRDIMDIKQTIVDRGATVMADKYVSQISASFNMGAAFEVITFTDKQALNFNISANPAALINISKKYRTKKTPVKSRNLSFSEITEVVNSPLLSDSDKIRLKLFLSLGQRLEQIYSAEMCDINFDNNTWLFPFDGLKGKRNHLIPLTHMHVDLIKQAYSLCGSKGKYLFPNHGNPDAKKPTKGKSLAANIRRFRKKSPLEKFTAGDDLRRTFKTRMAELKVPKLHRDMVQNHRAGDVSDTVYDMWEYADEKRSALEIWCEKLETVFKPKINRPSDTFLSDLNSVINSNR